MTASPSEINDWRWQFAPVDVVILVGGPREVVEKALGQPVEEARAGFAVYAAAMVRGSRHLPGIAERYGSPWKGILVPSAFRTAREQDAPPLRQRSSTPPAQVWRWRHRSPPR